jgi:ribosomal-protein-alanine N-acetyltransferase
VRNLRRVLRKEPQTDEHREELLAGFVGLWFMLEECHVVTVAVREALRRQGIGELLVITAIDLALRREQEVLTLECRVSNTAAQALYEKYGFERVGVRRRYYTDNNEDALIMTTPPIHTPEYGERFERLRAAHAERWGAADTLLPV